MTVMHRDGVTHHRRQDHRVTRPGLHELFLVALVHLLDLLLERGLDERALAYGAAHLFALPLLWPGRHEAVRLRVPTGLQSHRGLAPRRLRHAADRGLRLTTTVRVVARRHHDATHRRAPAHATPVARAADLAVLVLDVAELTDGRAAAELHDADAAARETDLRVLAFLRHELRHAARRAHELT